MTKERLVIRFAYPHYIARAAYGRFKACFIIENDEGVANYPASPAIHSLVKCLESSNVKEIYANAENIPQFGSRFGENINAEMNKDHITWVMQPNDKTIPKYTDE